MSDSLYVVLQWTDSGWTLADDLPVVQSNLSECKRWFAAQADIPTPKRVLRDIVVFQFGKQQMQGEVQKIEITYSNRLAWFGGPGFSPIKYTVYSNGHGRYVSEDNLKGL